MSADRLNPADAANALGNGLQMNPLQNTALSKKKLAEQHNDSPKEVPHKINAATLAARQHTLIPTLPSSVVTSTNNSERTFQVHEEQGNKENNALSNKMVQIMGGRLGSSRVIATNTKEEESAHLTSKVIKSSPDSSHSRAKSKDNEPKNKFLNFKPLCR